MIPLLAILLAQATPTPAPTLGVAEPRTFAESLTSLADGTLLVGSSATGAIARLRPGEQQATRWIAPPPGAPRTVFGVLADERRGMLWACESDAPPGRGRTALAAFRLADGARLATLDFPGPGLCNDIAIAPDGTVYATDISGARVVRLRPGGAPELWLADKALAGVDGIALLRDGRMVLNSLTSGKLWAVTIDRGGTAGPLAELMLSRPLERPDGMRTGPDGALYVVESPGRLARVRVSGKRARVETLADGLVEPTAVTLARGSAYVVQGHLSYVMRPDRRGQDPGPTGIYVLPLRR